MPMGFDEARHLLNRTSFAANVDDIEAFAKLTRAQAVDQLLAWTASTKVMTPPPAWINEYQSPRRLRTMSEDQRKLAQRELIEQGAELRAWWMTEMLTTPSPLTEKMVLFWHNHFVSSQQKVRSPRAHVPAERCCCASTRSATSAICCTRYRKDPAMLIYLDNASNRKAQPNENFAREVMELFTLGEGNYSEAGHQGSRARVHRLEHRPRTGEFLVAAADARRRREDRARPQRQFRRRRRARHPARAAADRASSSSRKLWREFVSPSRTPREVQAHRAHVSRQPLQHQGRAARAADRGRVLRGRRTARR